jgi:tetratricopeptide (TPR) repeat protein
MREKEEDFSFAQLFIPLTTRKVIGIISVLGIIVFFNALFNGFVWDDTAYILSNTDIHSFSLSKIWGSSFFNKDGYYRPLPAFYFTLLYAFFQKQAFFYHFSQVVLHIINTFLVFRLFKGFFKKEAALILSLFFLVHPIMVESVAFIGATISPLFVFFGLGALQILIAKKPLTPLRYGSVMLLLFLSFLTKEGGMLFFFILLLWATLFRKEAFKKLFFFSGLLVPVYLFLRIAVGKVYLTHLESTLFGQGSTASDGRFVPIMELSLLQRVGMIPSIIWYYLKTVFYPAKLAVDQTWVITTLTIKSFYLPLLLLMLLGALLSYFTWLLYQKKSTLLQPFLFFICWFIIGMLMHIQLLPLDMTVADRWFYFPFIGLLGMLFVMIEYFFPLSKTKHLLIPLSCAILLMLSVRTMVRNANYSDEITLYSHDRLVEDNYEIELNLGSAYGVAGNLDQTLTHYQNSVTLFPNEANYDSMGLFSEWKGNLSDAKMYYEKARLARSFYLNPKKRLSLTYIRLSYIYLRLHQAEKAREVCLEGLKQYPNEHVLWLQLAQSDYLSNHQVEALISVAKAKALSPDENTIKTEQIIQKKQPLLIQ